MVVRINIQQQPQGPGGDPIEIDWDAEFPARVPSRMERAVNFADTAGRWIIHQTANAADFFSLSRERNYTAPLLEGAHDQERSRQLPETMDDQVVPVLEKLNKMDTISEPVQSTENLGEAEERLLMGKLDEDLRKQCDIFVDNASVYMAISWISWATDKPIDDSLLMELMKEATLREDGNKRYLWDVIASKDYYLNLGSENSIFGKEISWYINRFIGWITCWLAYMILAGTIQNACDKILNFASKGSEQNDTLVKIGGEFSKILNRITGKYLKAVETFVKGQDKEGVLSEHLAEEMSKIRGNLESGIYRDFSSLFCDNFLPWIQVNTDGRYKPLKYFLWALCWIVCWLPIGLLHLYIRYKGLPDAIHSVLHTSAGAMKFKPAQHALNCTLEPHLNALKDILRDPSASGPDVKDVQELQTKQNIAEAVSKLLKILSLEPFHTKDEMEKVLHGTGKSFFDNFLDADGTEKILSAITKLTQGKTVDELVNEALNSGMKDILIIAFNYFLKPIKAKQVLSKIMEAFNGVFDRRVLKTTEEWQEWQNEYREKKMTIEKICDGIVRMFVHQKAQEVVNGPHTATQNDLLQKEVGNIKEKIFKCRDEMKALLETLPGTLDNNDPVDALKQVESMRNAIKAVASGLFLDERKDLSEAAIQTLLDATRGINNSYQKIAEMLVQIKEMLLFKKYFLKMRGVKETLLTKMKNIAAYLREKDPGAGSEIQEIKDILSEIQSNYKDSKELSTLDPYYRTMSNNVSNIQINQIALDKLSLLRSSPAINLLIQLVKKAIQNQRPLDRNDLQRVDDQIAELIRFLPTASMKDAIRGAIARIVSSSTQEILDQYLEQLEQIIAEQKADIESTIRHQISDFENTVDQWSSALEKIMVETYTTRETTDKEDIKAKLINLNEELDIIEKQVKVLEKVELKEQPSSLGSTIASIGSGIVSGVASVFTGLVGLILGGPAVAVGTAAAAGLAADAFKPDIEESLTGAGHAIEGVVKDKAVKAIHDVLMPKLMKKVDSLYSLLQKEHTWQGLGNGALDATVTCFNQR
ncbi:MAG TPA: hypothetical protein VLG44_04880 [Chlamydiales bacterium]|nr:hypothetical protein [Chlamydiales bacterium]